MLTKNQKELYKEYYRGSRIVFSFQYDWKMLDKVI